MENATNPPLTGLDLRDANPMLSVVIVIRGERERVQKTLRSVLDQETIDRIEVLIMDCAPEQLAASIPGSDHHHVRVLRMPEVQSFGSARARGAELAVAPVVAFLEEHVYVLPGWGEAVAQAFAGPWAAVGGEVHNANPGAGISDSFAQMTYFRWLPPAKAGEYSYVPLHNTSYRKDVLLRYGKRLPELLSAEFAFQKQLITDGYKLYIDPAIKWAHMMETSMWTASRGTFLISRAVTAVRAEESRWSLFEKIARIVLMPAIPFFRVLKDLAWLVSKRRESVAAYALNVPVIFTLFCVSVVAQTVGLIWGMGDTHQQFLRYESESFRQSSNSRPIVRASK